MDKYVQLSPSSHFAIIETIIILLIVCLLPGLYNPESLYSTIVIAVIILFFSLLSIVGLYNYPLSVTVDSDAININYVIHQRNIPLSSIVSISKYSGDSRFFPVIGSYGFLGWWGLYANSKIGTFRLTASNLSEMIILTYGDGRIFVFSCSDAEEMETQIMRHLTV